MLPKCIHGKDIWQNCEECPAGEIVGVDPNRPYPEGIAFDEAWRQSQRADAAEAQRDSAIKHIAEWCVAIDVNGSGWDDWDEYYKDAMYSERKSLPEIRGLLMDAIVAARDRRDSW